MIDKIAGKKNPLGPAKRLSKNVASEANLQAALITPPAAPAIALR
jgi:hypothetical protein